MDIELFNYHLPDELIAQQPAKVRGESRMLVVDRLSGECVIRPFQALAEYLSPGDLILVNNTKVMNARMFGYKNGNPDAAKIEILLIAADSTTPRRWSAFIKPGKRVAPGTRIRLIATEDSKLASENWLNVEGAQGDGTYMVNFETDDITGLQQQYGHLPLPPYIRRSASNEDQDRYQTVFAKHAGAVAAPTAGLHFTPEFSSALISAGIRTAELTLHVGPGTFKPVTVANITEHHMHSENFILPDETASLINSTRLSHNKILAVGTTTVRVIESCANPDGTVHPASGSTSIFMHPPYRPKVADMLLTNFHLPQSTLLMLVATFIPRELMLEAYQFAIREKMRFYSYGDCMLLK